MTIRARFPTSLLILALLGFLAVSSTASAAYPIAKDGKIYACFKTKGKGKGAVRVIRSPKVRCPRKWRKMAWNATVRPGPEGPAGATGATGGTGERGIPGTDGNVAVENLEGKVAELLTRIEVLEELIPTVQTLCSQVETLTAQLNSVESAVEGLGLNAVLTTLGGILEIPTLPGALPSFSCPSS